MNRNQLLRVGAALAALGVAAGAFGAHGLRAILSPKDLETWETAVRYLLLHAVALVAIASLPQGTRRAGLAAALVLAGTLVFSGTLFLLVLADLRWLGAITPIGGVLMIAGWVVLASAALPPRDAPAA
jgi:uncharacterized membrane protein YgdD (TMEM256/DUF423 family)